jgi:DNA-binding transcriptional regulator YiaG
MKYESDILEMIHENAIAEFQLGLITEAEMRKYDKLCLPEEALQDNAHETVTIEHPELATA